MRNQINRNNFYQSSQNMFGNSHQSRFVNTYAKDRMYSPSYRY